jgi:hypothetical protein
VDQRLVRQRYLHQCDHAALAFIWYWSPSPTPKASVTTPMKAWSECSAWTTRP